MLTQKQMEEASRKRRRSLVLLSHSAILLLRYAQRVDQAPNHRSLARRRTLDVHRRVARRPASLHWEERFGDNNEPIVFVRKGGKRHEKIKPQHVDYRTEALAATPA